MCGRYFTNEVSWEEYRASLDFQIPPDTPDPRPAYNIAPTQRATIFRQGEDSMIASHAMWGLVPFWWKKPLKDKKFSTFNARDDKLETAASYKTAYKRRRCLVPAGGFYEWKGPKGQKQPYAIGLQNRRWFCFAGLWDQATIEGEVVESFTIITTSPNVLMQDIHNRMPVILDPSDYGAWLDHASEDYKTLLDPFPADYMHAWPVGKAVGNVRNQGQELIEEVQVLGH